MRHTATSRSLRHLARLGLAFFAHLALGASAAAAILEYALPASRRPSGITAGPDGALWFTTYEGYIGRVTTFGVTSEYSLPAIGPVPMDIVTGPDGNLWFTERAIGQIGRITTAGVVTEFTLPAADSSPWGIAAGSDGNLWFTESYGGRIGRITPAGVITEWTLPQPDAFPTGITAGPDGNLWFTESGSDQIGCITTSGVLTEFPLAQNVAPFEIVTGSDGNLWFTEYVGNKIGRMTTAGVLTEFDVPTPAGAPTSIAAGRDGRVYFGEEAGLKIGSISTFGLVTEVPLPPGGGAFSMATGSDGNLWFAELIAGKIATLKVAAVKGDFDADGRPDLVLNNTITGVENSIWLMNGVVRKSQATVVPDAPSADWRIRAADDFGAAPPAVGNRDFKTDLVFWNSVTGAVEFWLMNGATRAGGPVPLFGALPLPPAWELAATGDFNHDARPDIVWRNVVTRSVVIWTMSGVFKTGEIVPTPAIQTLNWDLIAAADYDGDGETDLLWQDNVTGTLSIWRLDAGAVRIATVSTAPGAPAGFGWRAVASADYSGVGIGSATKGSPDIVWRNDATGRQLVWHMDFAGGVVAGTFTLPLAPLPALGWAIVGPR